MNTKHTRKEDVNSALTGRTLALSVVASMILFLILHSTELPFQEYGDRLLLTLVRVLIFGPLLLFFYMGFRWARITLSLLCTLLLVAGTMAWILVDMPWITPTNAVFLSVMMFCVAYTAVVLFFSRGLRCYLASKSQR